MKTMKINKIQASRFVLSLIGLMALAPLAGWGQTDYSGIYYIASGGKGPGSNNTYSYNSSSSTNNFYLCPTEGWCFYKPVDDFAPHTSTDYPNPFLTTYKCRTNDYHEGNPSDAIWTIEKAPNSNYYYIKQTSTGKYLLANGQIRTTDNPDRIRVHLQSVNDLSSVGDNALYSIVSSGTGTSVVISPKGITDGTSSAHTGHENHKWLTVNNGNYAFLTGQSPKTGGPDGYSYTSGIICIYTQSDANAPFYLEPATVAPPTITNNFDGTITISTETGATIYYTTDGTTPTTSDYNGTGTTSVTFSLTDGVTVIQAIAKDASDYFPSLPRTYNIPVCERPVITVNNNIATITCSTSGATIYYTTNDTEATTGPGSTLYEGSFSAAGVEVIRAIAISPGYLQSGETIYAPPVTVHFSSEIGDMSRSYILASDFASTAPIGTAEAPFMGIIDGQLNTFSGFTNSLVAYADGAVIKNVILANDTISSGTNVGAICNKATGATRIYNCGVLSGEVGGSEKVGGIVGLLDGTSRVINCFSYATITGGNDVGGIVGYNNGNTYWTKGATGELHVETMVMNCMFYGDITGGTNVSPVYGGNNINNVYVNDDSPIGLNTFNYYAYDKLVSTAISDGKYNCALAVEEKYLNRFEFYRLLLNSNKKLAAFYATGSVEDADQKMAKWVLETADRTITGREPYPYPILKAQGSYPSIINPDIDNAPDSTTVGPNKGGKLGRTLSVTILTKSQKTAGGQSWPTADGSDVQTTSLDLKRTDKDFDRFNFNYDKVQLPYYNDIGTGNYTESRVVTGWKITAITAVDGDPYTASNYPTTGVKDFPDHNYADRKSSNKDLYTVSKRVFSQGAYFDVPYGVSSITIEPYWGQAAYIADANYDVVYKDDYTGKQNVTQAGTQITLFNSQTVHNNMTDALTALTLGSTVYDKAVVLVGNLHLDDVPSNGSKAFSMMSVDEDNDNEPDYSLIYHHINRKQVSPIRFDFLNIPGTAQAQKPNGASLICNFTIFKTKGWFEITNTALAYSTQMEYENLEQNSKSDAPLILLGGVFDQFVSTRASAVNGNTIYIHVGGNVWINQFGLGTHSDGSQSTPHVPVSVTGGDFVGFYLTGTYNPNADVLDDNAECYISGGRFAELAGACQEQLGSTNSSSKGNVRWQIYNVDIKDFYGGGLNDAKAVQGNITTEIFNSRVGTFCGGPKFGNMVSGKAVTTNAVGCTFGRYFGAGYGGNSYSRKKYKDTTTIDFASWQNYYYKADGSGDRGKYYNGLSTNCPTASYGKKGPGVATDFDYEFFVWSTGLTGARFFVKFVSFSLAQCNDVNSTLKRCTINGNFYGGGSLGKVTGTAISELEDCTVHGDAYGAGFSATLPTIWVRNKGFKPKSDSEYYFPQFNSSSGMFEEGVLSDSTEFTWEQVTSYPNEGGAGFDGTQVITTTSLDHADLGSVGAVDLTIKGNTTIEGHVFGGGEESQVSGNTLVKILDHTKVYGNIYGGGNEGVVGGNTKVIVNGHTSTGQGTGLNNNQTND